MSTRLPRALNALAWLILVVPGFVLAGDDYMTTFTPKANQAYQEDINVWVYTKEFAERFGMPDKWASDSLEGAFAAAYRVEVSSALTFFPHKGEGVSKTDRRCLLDLYLPNDADIRWSGRKMAGKWWYAPDSPKYLIPTTEKDRKWQWRPWGVADRAVIRYDQAGFGGMKLVEFVRKLYPGIDYLSFNMTCTTPGDGAADIEFRPKGTSRKNAEAVTHTVHLPKRFMQDLYAKWKTRSRDPSEGEWKKVINGE